MTEPKAEPERDATLRNASARPRDLLGTISFAQAKDNCCIPPPTPLYVFSERSMIEKHESSYRQNHSRNYRVHRRRSGMSYYRPIPHVCRKLSYLQATMHPVSRQFSFLKHPIGILCRLTDQGKHVSGENKISTPEDVAASPGNGLDNSV